MKEIQSLPSRQLTTVEVAAVQQSDGIVDMQPQFVDVTQEEAEDSVIGLTIIFESGNVSVVCFDPEESVWMRIVSDDTENIDSIDSQLDEAFEWMTERYGEEGYATVGTV